MNSCEKEELELILPKLEKIIKDLNPIICNANHINIEHATSIKIANTLLANAFEGLLQDRLCK
jgi:hypothetical protein